jgi:hypothetical protein
MGGVRGGRRLQLSRWRKKRGTGLTEGFQGAREKESEEVVTKKQEEGKWRKRAVGNVRRKEGVKCAEVRMRLTLQNQILRTRDDEWPEPS